MANRFISFLEAIGRDFEKYVIPIAETAGKTAISLFAPGLSPLFNSTVNAVITAEQNAAAIGKQTGSGPQKLAAVTQLMGPLISQSLAIIGKTNDQAAVQNYINAVVTILNTLPANLLPSMTTAAPVQLGTGGTVS